MATPNRWAIKEAGIATFYDLTTGKARVTLTTLKTSGVETTGETVYARGGRGNAKLVGFSSNREAKITLQDAIFDNAAIAMLTGNDLVAGTKKVDRNEVGSVTSSKITLDKTPQGAIVSVFKLNPDGTNGEEYTLGAPASEPKAYSVVGKELTFNSAVTNGTQFRIYYQVNTATDAKTIKVTSDQFGKSFRVVLDCLVVDEFTKAAFQGQLRIPNAKFEDNFNLS
ncbi:hypothetical protein AF332_11225 [Sporosarcina globispora]|uniref:Phage tail protein n=1 Tax=Sporosarcina globispora TaxID=1459 RepID=A0A0M0GBP9_SPOGL|nr:hypothetical protein [Sporosarcina globispora]KON87340.1 hypothetical protein AF332_11225 [Sporosarcina globispora]